MRWIFCQSLAGLKRTNASVHLSVSLSLPFFCQSVVLYWDIPVCLFVFLFVCLFLPIGLSVWLSIWLWLTVCLSDCLFHSLTDWPCVYLFVSLCACISDSQSILISVCLCLSAHLCLAVDSLSVAWLTVWCTLCLFNWLAVSVPVSVFSLHSFLCCCSLHIF